MRLPQLACALMLLCVGSSAMASKWVNVTSSADYTAAIDTDSLKRSGDLALFWERRTFPNYGKLPNGSNYNVSRSRDTINCALDTYMASSIDFLLDGRVIETSTMPNPMDIRPDSVGAAIEKVVCTNGSPGANKLRE